MHNMVSIVLLHRRTNVLSGDNFSTWSCIVSEADHVVGVAAHTAVVDVTVAVAQVALCRHVICRRYVSGVRIELI